MKTTDPSYMVFQAYGNEAVFYECAFALLSFSRLYKKEELDKLQIWIYTDNPNWFKDFKDCWLPLHFREIDAATIKQWRGSIDFVHRVKIEVLLDFTQTHTGNILYLDTDIFFLKPVNELFANIDNSAQFMHVMEGLVRNEQNPVLKKLNNFLKSNILRLNTGEDVNVPPDISMWNAGVLGFKTNKALLAEVLNFTDSVYPLYPKHIIEQFAFSLYFQRAGEVKASEPYIYHYWNLKEIRPLLASFFEYFKNSNWDELVKLSELISIPGLMQQKTNFLQKRSIVQKLLNAKWQPQIPDWANLL